MHEKHPLRVFATASLAYTLGWSALGSLSDWGAYWLAWIFCGFLVPEVYGLLHKASDTLSDNTWAAEHLDFGHPFNFAEWSPLHWVIAVTIWGLAVWLSGHLPFAIWR